MRQIHLITSKSRWHTITALTDNALQVDLNTAAAQTFPLQKYLVCYWTVWAPPILLQKVMTHINEPEHAGSTWLILKKCLLLHLVSSSTTFHRVCPWNTLKLVMLIWWQDKERESLLQFRGWAKHCASLNTDDNYETFCGVSKEATIMKVFLLQKHL